MFSRTTHTHAGPGWKPCCTSLLYDRPVSRQPVLMHPSLLKVSIGSRGFSYSVLYICIIIAVTHPSPRPHVLLFLGSLSLIVASANPPILMSHTSCHPLTFLVLLSVYLPSFRLSSPSLSSTGVSLCPSPNLESTYGRICRIFHFWALFYFAENDESPYSPLHFS